MTLNILATNKSLSKNTYFNNFVIYWEQSIAINTYSPLTYQKNKNIINSRILPYLGKIKLKKINKELLKKYFNELSESYTNYKYIKNNRLSYSFIKRIKAIISAILQKAYELNLITCNPCHNLKIQRNFVPEHLRIKKNYYDKSTYVQVLKLIKNEPLPFRVLIELTLKTGMRKSEIFALTWEDFDLKKQLVSINKSRNYLNKIGMITKIPKNSSSYRTIYISKNLCDLLQEYKKLSNNTTYIFEDVNFNTITIKFIKWQKLNRIVPITFHGLRHTHATLLLDEKIDIKTISHRLGHSNITTTLNIYTHVLDDLDKKAANCLEKNS